MKAIGDAGYTGKIKIGMDVAASEFYREGKYDLDFKNKNSDPSKWVKTHFCTYFGSVDFCVISGVEEWTSVSFSPAMAKFS